MNMKKGEPFEKNLSTIKGYIVKIRQFTGLESPPEKDQLRIAWDTLVAETFSLVDTVEQHEALCKLVRHGDRTSKDLARAKGKSLGITAITFALEK
jgi:hypothetical protein